jgi:two-component sensor histidine kinase/CheY-like chemotaxis protein
LVRWGVTMVSESSNVLLIEDNLGDIVSIRTMISELSDGVFELKFAESLGEALTILENENFDVVLMDLGLPDSQGFRTFTQVHNQMPELPIIIITGLEDEDLGVSAVKEGAQDYLVKGQVDKKLLARSLKFAIERKQTEEELKSSIYERDVLLKETHHRVKNNMQVIHSLLNLQTHYAENIEAVNVLKESQNRVKSMGMIHEKLYNSTDRSKIDFLDYVNSLTSNLLTSYKLSEKIVPVIEIGDINLNLETAILCGLIINELVSNSLKYAFKPTETGEVYISLNLIDNRYELVISDNGMGFPQDLDFKNTESLGLQLVNNITDQLDGEIELDRSLGTKFTVKFDNLKHIE